MARGKLIAIEGTDCSGKETQTKELIGRMREDGYLVESMSFPRYDTATGRIVGGCYLGKESIGPSYFENPAGLDPKIASLYYLANRLEELPRMENFLERGIHVVTDRYVDSNKAHQGGKIGNSEERRRFYNSLSDLEYGFGGLPVPDLTIFLYMPWEIGVKLREGRGEAADAHERNQDHLRNAEEAYLQLAEMEDWITVNCAVPNSTKPRDKQDIAEEVYSILETERGFLRK